MTACEGDQKVKAKRRVAKPRAILLLRRMIREKVKQTTLAGSSTCGRFGGRVLTNGGEFGQGCTGTREVRSKSGRFLVGFRGLGNGTTRLCWASAAL